MLDAPRLGCFNLHASLLPRWRGAAPIQRAIMAGDRVTGVQVMRMSEGLDEGPILLSETVRIDALETAGSLHDRLAAVGAALLARRRWPAIERGDAVETAAGGRRRHLRQEDQAGGGAHRLDASPPPRSTAASAAFRPFPAPGSRRPRESGPVRIKALLSRVEDGEGAPGEVLDDALLIACGDGRRAAAARPARGPRRAGRGRPSCAASRCAAGARLG